MLAFLPTLYFYTYLQFYSLLTPINVGQCKIRNQQEYENYISWIQILLDELMSNGRAKMKVAMLTFLCFWGEFVKTRMSLDIQTKTEWLPNEMEGKFVCLGRLR